MSEAQVRPPSSLTQLGTAVLEKNAERCPGWASPAKQASREMQIDLRPAAENKRVVRRVSRADELLMPPAPNRIGFDDLLCQG
jgi:hypothetical protein